MGPGDADPHYGLEHFGFDVVDMDSEIERLEGLGAVLADGPYDTGDGRKIAFIKGSGRHSDRADTAGLGVRSDRLIAYRRSRNAQNLDGPSRSSDLIRRNASQVATSGLDGFLNDDLSEVTDIDTLLRTLFIRKGTSSRQE